jgi:isopropylmalate/homocitrate/citramalate synthase
LDSRLLQRLAAAGARRLEVPLRWSGTPSNPGPSIAVPVADGTELRAALRGSARPSEAIVRVEGEASSGRLLRESVAAAAALAAEARSAGLRCAARIENAFGARRSRAQIIGIAQDLVRGGAHEIVFDDTGSQATPEGVVALFADAWEHLDGELTGRFRGPRGQANALAALSTGCASLEAEARDGIWIGPRSANELMTLEVLATLLHREGVETGIDLARLAAWRALDRPAVRPSAQTSVA